MDSAIRARRGQAPGRRGALACALVLVAALGGCGRGLTPGPGATIVPNRAHAAVASAEGVRVVAQAGSWRGVPSDLEGLFTPILVTIDNGGPVPLRIRYDAFGLVAPDGRRFAAISPFDIRGTLTERIDLPFYAPYRYGPPYPARRYPGWSVVDPFPYDGWYYDHYYPAYREVPLPTGDMVQKALPETVLEPGERMTGFVYFEGVPSRVDRVDFVAALVDARTAAQVGTVSIPFVTG